MIHPCSPTILGHAAHRLVPRLCLGVGGLGAWGWGAGLGSGGSLYMYIFGLAILFICVCVGIVLVGQSNMELSLGFTFERNDTVAAIANGSYDNIRVYLSPHLRAPEPVYVSSGFAPKTDDARHLRRVA